MYVCMYAPATKVRVKNATSYQHQCSGSNMQCIYKGDLTTDTNFNLICVQSMTFSTGSMLYLAR